MWTNTKRKHEPTEFHAVIKCKQVTNIWLETYKNIAFHILLTSVYDDLVSTVAEHTHANNAWTDLKEQFSSGDNTPVLTLMNQLHTLKMLEGESVDKYIREARGLNNRLSNMGERMSNKQLN